MMGCNVKVFGQRVHFKILRDWPMHDLMVRSIKAVRGSRWYQKSKRWAIPIVRFEELVSVLDADFPAFAAALKEDNKLNERIRIQRLRKRKITTVGEETITRLKFDAVGRPIPKWENSELYNMMLGTLTRAEKETEAARLIAVASR